MHIVSAETVPQLSKRLPCLLDHPPERVVRGAKAECGEEQEGLLVPHEREVLACAALGYPDACIADKLGLAPGTVHNHLSSACAKLGAQTRGEAMVWAWRHGLIDLPPSEE